MKTHLPLERARETLGLGASFSPGDVAKAYRALVRAHPPDRDPDGFRRVRAAYDALCHPLRIWDEWVDVKAPHGEANLNLTQGARTHRAGTALVREALAVLLLREPLESLLPDLELDAIDRTSAPDPLADEREPADQP